MQVKDIMVQPTSIDKADTISHALDVMEKKGTRRLLVTHDNDLVGILTMRGLTKELGTRKKGTKPASSLHVATAVSDNYVKVLPDMDVNDAVVLMIKRGGVIIVSDNDNVLGWVTPAELLENVTFDGYAAEVMKSNPIIVHPADRVSHVRHQMLDEDVGRFPVLEDEKLMGIITEKDIAKSMRAFRDVVSGSKQDSRIKNLIVEDIMKRGVKTVNTNTPISDVKKMMLEENIGGVPVLNLEGDLVGLITRRTLVNTIAK
ncbi:CBS domain-containing protein [Methanococcoides sp. LMO-2]|uniref:CBS domain-containing protein n=1 Tax=Methanococcoides cohabitans TaxID=3136559 RepID=A0ABU9KVJ6_9EURY